MSWASERNTKREEDKAYCLLGIFNVNMPLIYGERKKAFLRLQLMILDQEEDYSILAWSDGGNLGNSLTGLLVSSPADFPMNAQLATRTMPQIPKEWHYNIAENGGFWGSIQRYSSAAVSTVPYYRYLLDVDYDSLQSYVPSKAGLRTGEKLPTCLSVKTPREPVRVTSRGLHLSMVVKMSVNPEVPSIAWIYCLYQGRLLCILLQQTNDSTVFARHSFGWLVTVDTNYLVDFKMNEIYGHAFGPVTSIEGIRGSLHPFHSALAELGKTEEAAELEGIQEESGDTKRIIANIRVLISELRHINPSNNIIQSRIDIGWLDRLEMYIEKQTASSWNWAPLNPPRRPCTENLWHIEWKCICGEKKWAQTPKSFAQNVLRLISQTGHQEPPINSQKEYCKNRGLLRDIFSVWRFSQCSFGEFNRIGKNVYELNQHIDLRKIVNDHYQHTPSPKLFCRHVNRRVYPLGFYWRSLFTRSDRGSDE